MSRSVFAKFVFVIAGLLTVFTNLQAQPIHDASQFGTSHTTTSLERYRSAAIEMLNSELFSDIIASRVLIDQSMLSRQLHISRIEQGEKLLLMGSTHHPVNTQRFIILSENYRFNASTGLIIDTRIIGDALTSDTSSPLLVLEVNSVSHDLQQAEILVLAEQPQQYVVDNSAIYTPALSQPAKLTHTLHNQHGGLVTIIDSGSNSPLRTGALLRYRNPGSMAGYDGILVVIQGISGAAYAAVINASANPMPNAEVF